MTEELTPSDLKEVLNDGQEHRFIFGPQTSLIVQRDTSNLRALSHYEMTQKHGISPNTAKGGRLIVREGEYMISGKRSTTLQLPNLEEFTAAINRGVTLD